MRFLLIGAGAVGGWIGANLLRAGHDVRFVGRERFCTAVRADGLRVLLPGGDAWHFSDVLAYTDIRQAVRDAHEAPVDAVIACMKAYAVGEAIADLRKNSEALQDAVFIPFQNGIGSDDAFNRAFGAEHVIAATLTTPVSLDAPNVVRMERVRGGVGMALPTPKGRSDVTATFAQAPLLQVAQFDNVAALRWSKLLLNIVGNATSAITRLRVQEIYAHATWSRVELRMMRECVAVIDAQHTALVNLPGAPAAWLARVIRLLPNALLRPFMQTAFGRARGDKWPSLYYDALNKTGRSEVAWLNGAIASAADELGVPAPVNRLQTELVLELVKPESRMSPQEASARLANVG